MFGAGLGIPRDDAKAAIWYRKAAERGLPDAQIQLGTMIGAGQGRPERFHRGLHVAGTCGGPRIGAGSTEAGDIVVGHEG